MTEVSKRKPPAGVWVNCYACGIKFWATGDKRRRHGKGRPCGCGKIECTNFIKGEVGRKKKGQPGNRSAGKVGIIPEGIKITPWIPYHGVGGSDFPALHNPF